MHILCRANYKTSDPMRNRAFFRLIGARKPSTRRDRISNEARKIRDVTSNVRSVGRGCVFFRFAAAEMEFASKGEQADPPARANNHRQQSDEATNGGNGRIFALPQISARVSQSRSTGRDRKPTEIISRQLLLISSTLCFCVLRTEMIRRSLPTVKLIRPHALSDLYTCKL